MFLPLLKTFKYEFVNCNQSKNKCVVFRLITVQTYATYIKLITTITTCSFYISAYNLFASNNCSLFFLHKYSLDLHNGDLQTTSVLFTRTFIQD